MSQFGWEAGYTGSLCMTFIGFTIFIYFLTDITLYLSDNYGNNQLINNINNNNDQQPYKYLYYNELWSIKNNI